MTYTPLLKYALQAKDQYGDLMVWNLEEFTGILPPGDNDVNTFPLEPEFGELIIHGMMFYASTDPDAYSGHIRICNDTVADISEDRATVALIDLRDRSLELIDLREEIENGHDPVLHNYAVRRERKILEEVLEEIYEAIREYETGGKSA